MEGQATELAGKQKHRLRHREMFSPRVVAKACHRTSVQCCYHACGARIITRVFLIRSMHRPKREERGVRQDGVTDPHALSSSSEAVSEGHHLFLSLYPYLCVGDGGGGLIIVSGCTTSILDCIVGG